MGLLPSSTDEGKCLKMLEPKNSDEYQFLNYYLIMNQIEQKALYNLLRMNWLNDSTLQVEPWQVEDYRELPLTELFERLKSHAVFLDKASFIAYANETDSPEEFTDFLVGDQNLPRTNEDQIYLLLFELWRRLMPEKPSLSIFCDELDYQAYLYDHGQLTEITHLQKALDNLISVLNENVDAGIDPKEAFQLMSDSCANDIETFLYDFISEQLDESGELYAQELLDSFAPYFVENKWFDLLQVRLLSHLNLKSALKSLNQLIEDHLKDQDLEFNFELLAFMPEFGLPQLFEHVVRQTGPLLVTEEDFQDLLLICSDYYERLDQEQTEKIIQDLIKKRSQKLLNEPFDSRDVDLEILFKTIESSHLKSVNP